MHTQNKLFAKRVTMRVAFLFLTLVITALFFPVVSGQSGTQAFGSGCSCAGVRATVNSAHSQTRAEVCDCYKDRMDKHEKWYEEFWKNNMLPAFQKSSAQNSQGQITSLQAQNAATDASNLVTTKRAREEQMVNVAQRFRGSEDAVCTQASIQQSLSATKELARGAAVNEAKARADNATGSIDGASPNGPANANLARFAAVSGMYCDSKSLGGLAVKLGCAAGDETKNLDISMIEIFYGRDTGGNGKIDESDSSNFDYTITGSEAEALRAFHNNLGMDKVFTNFNPNKVLSPSDLNTAKIIVMEQREVQARRSVAKNSFLQFSALFSPGSSAATEYLKGLYGEQGRPEALVNGTPSLFLQQKIVFHDLFSDPKQMIEMAADTPENAQRRTAAATMALNVQMFNIYEVLLRIDTNLAGINLTLQDDRYYAIENKTRQFNNR